VTQGGPPDVRELTDLIITKVSVRPMDNNCYLLRCRSTGEQVLIEVSHHRVGRNWRQAGRVDHRRGARGASRPTACARRTSATSRPMRAAKRCRRARVSAVWASVQSRGEVCN